MVSSWRWERVACAAVAVLIPWAAGCSDTVGPNQRIVDGGGGEVFATPNVLNNASFETGWDGFTDWTTEKPPTGVSRDNATASAGGWSVLRTWGPNSTDAGAQLTNKFSETDHVWIRYYFKVTNHVSTIMKFMRLYEPSFGGNFGGFYLQEGSNLIGWAFNAEDNQQVMDLGISEARVIDGQWHSLEVEYWRNGDPSGFPSAAFWLDGAELYMPDRALGGSAAPAFWRNKRLNAGERKDSRTIAIIEWLGTLNGGNTATGRVNIDRVAISTAGRIGP